MLKIRIILSVFLVAALFPLSVEASEWLPLGPQRELTLMTSLEGKLYGFSPDGRLWSLDPNASQPEWVERGAAKNPVALAGAREKLFMVTKDHRLWSGGPDSQAGDWKFIGYANQIKIMTGSRHKLYAALAGRLWKRDAAERNVNWKKVGTAIAAKALTANRDKIFLADADGQIWMRDLYVGMFKWRRMAEAPDLVDIAVIGNAIYAIASDGALLYKTLNLKYNTRKETIEADPAPARGTLKPPPPSRKPPPRKFKRPPPPPKETTVPARGVDDLYAFLQDVPPIKVQESETASSIRGDPAPGQTETASAAKSPDQQALTRDFQNFIQHPNNAEIGTLIKKIAKRIFEIESADPSLKKTVQKTWRPYFLEVRDQLLPEARRGLRLVRQMRPQRRETQEIYRDLQNSLENFEKAFGAWVYAIPKENGRLFAQGYQKLRNAENYYFQAYNKSQFLSAKLNLK